MVVLLVVNFDCKVQGHGRFFTKFLSSRPSRRRSVRQQLCSSKTPVHNMFTNVRHRNFLKISDNKKKSNVSCWIYPKGAYRIDHKGQVIHRFFVVSQILIAYYLVEESALSQNSDC